MRLFAAICSCTRPWGSAFPRSTCTGARAGSSMSKNSRGAKWNDVGEHARRERLDRRVQQPDLVVVVLPRVGDLRLGAGQLLLQRQEVRVGLQVRVVLGDGEQLAEPAVTAFSADGLIARRRWRRSPPTAPS